MNICWCWCLYNITHTSRGGREITSGLNLVTSMCSSLWWAFFSHIFFFFVCDKGLFCANDWSCDQSARQRRGTIRTGDRGFIVLVSCSLVFQCCSSWPGSPSSVLGLLFGPRELLVGLACLKPADVLRGSVLVLNIFLSTFRYRLWHVRQPFLDSQCLLSSPSRILSLLPFFDDIQALAMPFHLPMSICLPTP